MQKCIVKYKDSNENYNCWCNSPWCDNCSTKDLRSENECSVSIGGYCTCRLCGERKIKE
ncbi:hypothetical protein [Clostridium celatum]|uniref:Uncharacterized protein n=1 Tax=Clostridium celatum DSM 1785 TaxID=545697 RepID=L1Q7E3_9CLOT|nr:hypothetical protein [Clostridium celatum]EKY23863.1 hypothetical protein HMPREF0216_02876 [Clostridium celatum DSM 1785]